uniref:C2H2-type domain-containing protein n=1 Tax=Lutzomyia longipalpis TaxID=7200 RepID=A0A1B0GJM7_LUTLO
MNAEGNESSKVQKSFKCDQCPKICVNAFNLKMHRAAHVRKKNLHPCPYDDCEKVLQTSAGLYHHIRRNHKANQKKQESSGSAAKLRKIGHTKEKEFTHRQDLKIRISLTGKSVKLSASSRQLKLKARITPNDVRKSQAPSISLPEEEEADGDDQGQSDHLNEPEKTGIPCPKCGLCFQNERALTSHAWRHEPQKLRPSSAKDKEENAKLVQPKIAAVRGDVGSKNRVTKPTSNFTCDLCFKVYKTYRTLWSHKKSHKENNPIACPICGNYYRNKICLRGHLKRHRKAMNMQIFPRWTPRCKKPEEQSENEEIDEVEEEGSKESFSDGSEEEHEISKEKETTVETPDVIKVFTCNHCNFSCESQKSLLNHIKCHTKKGTLLCKTCAMRFKTVKALKIHSWRHTAVKCHICSYQVSDEVRLAQHIEKMHNVEVKVEKDDDDSPVRRQMPERSASLREASRKQNAAVASTSTSNEAVYDCSYCNEKFSVEESFEKHMRRKHNIEPEISGIFYPSTSYGESSSEIPKIMESSPEIPQKAPTPTMFQCDICSDKFNDKETRTRHIKEIHFGIKLT